jgi:hypothetical protein
MHMLKALRRTASVAAAAFVVTAPDKLKTALEEAVAIL